MRLTRVMNVSTNPFENPDRFRNAPPPRIGVFDVEYFGEDLQEG